MCVFFILKIQFCYWYKIILNVFLQLIKQRKTCNETKCLCRCDDLHLEAYYVNVMPTFEAITFVGSIIHRYEEISNFVKKIYHTYLTFTLSSHIGATDDCARMRFQIIVLGCYRNKC